MKIVTFKDRAESGSRYRIGAVIDADRIADLTSLISEKSLTAAELLPCFDLDMGFLVKSRIAEYPDPQEA